MEAALGLMPCDFDERVRLVAIEKLTDREALRGLAETAASAAERQAAKARLLQLGTEH